MKLKSLLFGSAAVIAAGTGAQAADLPVAEPVEYVRICDAFGEGFYYLPGTDTCLKIGGYVRVEAHYVDTLGDDDEDDEDDEDGVEIDDFLLGADDPELNNFTTRARGVIDVDARTQTDWALVRVFIQYELQVDGAANTPGDVEDEETGEVEPGETNYSGTEVSLAAAFLQISNDWGTFTAGHTGSFFDFFGSFGFGTRLDIDDNTTEQTLFAFTKDFGNGFSGTISLEDPASSGRRKQPGDIGLDEDVDEFSDYEGQESPDGVVNLRLDQGWGSAQIMGVVGQIHDNDTFDPEDGSGERDGEDGEDTIGWAVGAGLSTNIPILGGLEFGAQGGYSEGRIGYITTDPGEFGDFVDLIGDGGGGGDDDEDGEVDPNVAWMGRAGVRASFTERWDASVSGSYTHVETDIGGDDEDDGDGADAEYDFWAVGGNIRFKPIDGLYMGPEVVYNRIEFDNAGDGGDEDEDDVDEFDDAIAFHFRINRSF